MAVLSCPNFYILFLFSFLSVVSLRADDLISDVCRSTADPSFCTNALRSDPRSKTAILPKLEIIAIELGTKSATATSVKIRSLISGAKDPHSKSIYSQCSLAYASILNSFNDAKGFANAGNYRDANIQASGVASLANFCENLFKQPPPIQSPLSQDNRSTGNYGEIIAVISNLLRH